MVRRTLLVSMLLLAGTLTAAQNQPLPKPQVESAEGKPVPDSSDPTTQAVLRLD